MTEPPTAAERPITFEVWHPSLADALASRPRLLEAWLADAGIREQVRQINVVLVALAKVTTRDLELGEQLLADPTILPTDHDLLQAAHQKLHLQRMLALGVREPVVVPIPPCPECAQGKCPNCTGETMVLDVLVTCPCDHPALGGSTLPMGGCSTASEHYRHLGAGDPKCENQR